LGEKKDKGKSKVLKESYEIQNIKRKRDAKNIKRKKKKGYNTSRMENVRKPEEKPKEISGNNVGEDSE
jgi:hypothetical protein